jgi:hypothetical protein
MHLKAQGIKFSERTADSLEIPPFSKGCVKTSKVMMDLMKVRYGNHYSDDSGSVVVMVMMIIMIVLY